MRHGQIRIIAGELCGRHIPYVPTNARPTPAKLRKALFDILGYIESYNFFDLFAGSGSVGIEAISRGVKRTTFIEIEKSACNLIRKNLDALNIGERRAKIICCEALRWLASHKLDTNEIIFASPPYITEFLYKVLSAFEKKYYGLPGETILVLQYPKRLIRKEIFSNEPSRIHTVGDDVLIFWF